MSAVRRRNTKPELALRKALHAMGFRYRLNVRALAGAPDLVLTSRDALIFVHGCFWHGHDCALFVLPRSRREFWFEKIGRNQLRDRRNHIQLRSEGWRVGTVWECAMRGRDCPGVTATAADVAQFLRTSDWEEMHFRDTGAHDGAGFPPPLADRFESAQVTGVSERDLDGSTV
jgi:DNA mismatch endonuclease (patch repair protein)